MYGNLQVTNALCTDIHKDKSIMALEGIGDGRSVGRSVGRVYAGNKMKKGQQWASEDLEGYGEGGRAKI